MLCVVLLHELIMLKVLVLLQCVNRHRWSKTALSWTASRKCLHPSQIPLVCWQSRMRPPQLCPTLPLPPTAPLVKSRVMLYLVTSLSVLVALPHHRPHAASNSQKWLSRITFFLLFLLLQIVQNKTKRHICFFEMCSLKCSIEIVCSERWWTRWQQL